MKWIKEFSRIQPGISWWKSLIFTQTLCQVLRKKGCFFAVWKMLENKWVKNRFLRSKKWNGKNKIGKYSDVSLGIVSGWFLFYNLSLATESHGGPVFSTQLVRHDFLVLFLSYISVKITYNSEPVVQVLAKILVTCTEPPCFDIQVSNGSFEQAQASNTVLIWNNSLIWHKIFDTQPCTDSSCHAVLFCGILGRDSIHCF